MATVNDSNGLSALWSSDPMKAMKYETQMMLQQQMEQRKLYEQTAQQYQQYQTTANPYLLQQDCLGLNTIGTGTATLRLGNTTIDDNELKELKQYILKNKDNKDRPSTVFVMKTEYYHPNRSWSNGFKIDKVFIEEAPYKTSFIPTTYADKFEDAVQNAVNMIKGGKK